MKKYSIDAEVLLSEAELCDVKGGVNPGGGTCYMTCSSCTKCSSCDTCTTGMPGNKGDKGQL